MAVPIKSLEIQKASRLLRLLCWALGRIRKKLKAKVCHDLGCSSTGQPSAGVGLDPSKHQFTDDSNLRTPRSSSLVPDPKVGVAQVPEPYAAAGSRGILGVAPYV